MEKKLKELYYNPSLPSAYGGVNPLYRSAKDCGFTLKQVKDFLQRQRAYTLHKPVVNNFPRNRVLSYGAFEQLETDLIDLTALARHNEGFRYIIIYIDTLTKYAYAAPLRSKRGEEVTQVSRDLLRDVTFKTLRSDAGGEYLNSSFQKFLMEKGVKHFVARSETKASLAERFIRTLKSRLFCYFTAKGSYKYIHILSEFIKAYNGRYHTAIKMTPEEATSRADEAQRNLFHDTLIATAPQRGLHVGDEVRLSLKRHAFTRGFQEQWSEETFKISEILHRKPFTLYRVTEADGTPIDGLFYKQQLQRVVTEGVFTVEKVLKTRQRRGYKKEYLVSWVGYPEKYNSWVTELCSLEGRT